MKTPSIFQRGSNLDDSFMTPMIDVVFQLLIFFVCASVGQIAESHLPVPLKAGSVASAQPVEIPPPLGELKVRLSRADGPAGRAVTRAEVNGRSFDNWLSLRGTLKELATIAPEMPVILDIDAGVPAGDFIDVFDTCRAAGYHDVRFATGP